MNQMHTFACPVFALQNELASGNTIPKWSPRARLGINLGRSPIHARNVYLVLNITTGLVSPQFHVKFDDLFETTRYAQLDSGSSFSTWKQLAGLTKINNTPSPSLDDIPGSVEPESSQQPLQDFEDDTLFASADEAAEDHSTPDDYDKEVVSSHHNPNSTVQPTIQPTVPPATTVNSRGRTRTPSRRMVESTQQQSFHGKQGYYTANSITEPSITPEEAHDEHLLLQERMRHPIAFHAEMMGDVMYYHQAMKQDDADEFLGAVVKEVNGHVENNNWELVERSAVPDDQDVVPSVWSMRRKRNLTTNEITKYKARLNVHGGKQTFGVNYFETYAPVVTWFAIRLLIVFAILFKWHLKQVDFVMAYTQAPIENDLYMDLPHGIDTKHGNSKDFVLKLTKNLYGQKQGGRVWNRYLVDKLRSIGFEQSAIDECVFYRGSTIFVVYVDDGLVLDPEERNLTNFVKELSDIGLKLEDQGHPADYVGVHIHKDREGYYYFSQLALIDSIIEDAHLTQS